MYIEPSIVIILLLVMITLVLGLLIALLIVLMKGKNAVGTKQNADEVKAKKNHCIPVIIMLN